MKFAEHVKIRTEKFGTVIFDTLTEKIFITDPIGGEILQLIQQERALPAIIDELSSRFAADEASIQNDVIEFVDHLKSSQMVQVEETLWDSTGKP